MVIIWGAVISGIGRCEKKKTAKNAKVTSKVLCGTIILAPSTFREFFLLGFSIEPLNILDEAF